MYQYSCRFVCKKEKKAFTSVNTLMFLLPFILFVLLLFHNNFKFNFRLNFNIISLQIGLFPIKEKLLGLLELTSRM